MSESRNGTVNKLLLVLVSILAGIVLTGGGMVIRGDFLGSDAAEAVENRLNKRIDREFSYIREQLREIDRKLEQHPHLKGFDVKVLNGPYFRCYGMQTEMGLADTVVQWAAYRLGAKKVIRSSGSDRVHGRGSLHYKGFATDYVVTGCDQWSLGEEIAQALGPEYDVVVEEDHIHVEYDPKVGLNK